MEPIEYQIVLNVQAALLAMTLAGGYHYRMAGAAVKLDPNVDVEKLVGDTAIRPFVVLEVLPETWSYSPANRVALVLPINVHWVSDTTEETDEDRIRTFFRGCADVERALAKDIGRGGLASDTRVVRRVLDRTLDGSEVWAIIQIEIRAHRVFGQPDS